MQKRPKTGLARALSKMGYCSRSHAVILVRSGRVTLNGRLVRDPEMPMRLRQDRIAVDSVPVGERPRVYLAMNKPRGLVTTASDEEGRATVYDLLKSSLGEGCEWVSPVGRLDKASEGLLLFTNDSQWAAGITDPETHLEKRYHVQVDCVAADNLLARIREGVDAGGDHLRAKEASVLRRGAKNSWLEITLDEGKNRHIRRLLEVFGVHVLRLMRVSIGPLQLGDLKKGEVRPLTEEEKRMIDKILDSGKSPAGRSSRRVPRNVG